MTRTAGGTSRGAHPGAPAVTNGAAPLDHRPAGTCRTSAGGFVAQAPDRGHSPPQKVEWRHRYDGEEASGRKPGPRRAGLVRWPRFRTFAGTRGKNGPGLSPFEDPLRSRGGTGNVGRYEKSHRL